MLTASCRNCIHQRSSGCELGFAPDAGNVLCKKYAMTVEFREKILDLMREDMQRQLHGTMLRVQVRHQEDAGAIAG